MVNPLSEKKVTSLKRYSLTLAADLSDWAPLTDFMNLDVKWHVPSDEETECAIELLKTATESKRQQIQNLLDTKDNGEVRKISAEWTDELRESLKYLVSVMLAAIPLFQRCTPPEDWEVKVEDVPEFERVKEKTEDDDSMLDVEHADVEDEEAAEEEDEDFSDADADGSIGRSQRYADGFLNRPLNSEQIEIMKTIYIEIGRVLAQLTKYLVVYREDDMQSFIELTTTVFCWLHPQGMANMNDIRMEMTSSAISNIRRAAFVIKGLGKAYYPEAILVQRVEGMHRERVSHNFAVKPSRTWWQDSLIKDVVQLTISPYVDVRRYCPPKSKLTIVPLKEVFMGSFDGIKSGRQLSFHLSSMRLRSEISKQSREPFTLCISIHWSTPSPAIGSTHSIMSKPLLTPGNGSIGLAVFLLKANY